MQSILVAHWAELDYGFSAGQHAVLPEGKKAINIDSNLIAKDIINRH